VLFAIAPAYIRFLPGASGRPGTPRAPPGGMATATSLRILIADDNRATAFTLGKALEKRGNMVTVVLNGLAAMDAVREFRPQVALVDIGMPGMDGYEVTRRIRREPGFETIPIIVISARGTSRDIERSLAAGANQHLVKPVDFDALWMLLEEAGQERG
jgi:two-component system CheB/CheR fusion protein